MGSPDDDEHFLADWYNARVLVAAEWAPAIMVVLRQGPLHYRDILTAVRATHASDGWPQHHSTLHDSILARSLKRLTQDGMIRRCEDRNVFPQSVRYSLTSAGQDILHAVVPLASWSQRYEGLIANAQANRFDQQPRSRPGL